MKIKQTDDMIRIKDNLFDVESEGDLFRSHIIFKLTFSSTGQCLIMASDGPMLGALRRWLSDHCSRGRLHHSQRLEKAIRESHVIRVDILWQGNGNITETGRRDKDPEKRRLVALYDRMYGMVWEHRTFMPYGYNDLTIAHHVGGVPATGSVMRMRMEHGLHRVRDTDGSTIFVEIKGHERQKKKPRNNFRLLQYDLEYRFIREWGSIAEAARHYGMRVGTLRDKASQCRTKSTGEVDNAYGGFRWFSDYRADWYEKEVDEGGGWKYTGVYDAKGYCRNPRANHDYPTKNYGGKRPRGARKFDNAGIREVVDNGTERAVIDDVYNNSLIIMGGLTDE